MPHTTPEKIKEALSFLNADDREIWYRAGMAIHDELGVDGYPIWNEWGKTSASHKENDAQNSWRSFQKSGIHIGTLFKMAMDAGWRPPITEPKRNAVASEKKAWGIWKKGTPPNGHAYLKEKAVKNHGLRADRDSLIVPLCDVAGNLKTVEYILSDKREDGKNKLLMPGGTKQGAFFVIGAAHDLSHQRIALLEEGYSTGASLHEATGHPAVMCVDAGNMAAVARALREAYPRLPLLICGDNDAHKPKNTGMEAAKKAVRGLIGGCGWCVPDFCTPTDAEILEAMGDEKPTKAARQAALERLIQRDRLRYEAEKPKDWNDLARWFNGPERIRRQIEAAIAGIGRIDVRPGDLAAIVRRAEDELLFGGGVYQRSGELVRPVRHDAVAGKKDNGIDIPEGALRLAAVTPAWLNERFGKVGTWRGWREREQEWAVIDPPAKYALTYVAKVGEWRAPVLTGIVECPTLRPDGSLIDKSGYDARSGLFIDYSGDPIHVPDEPTREQALKALETLKEPFSEFSFADPAVGLSTALAAVLTAICRRSLPTAPLFAFDAPVMGSGKGLCVKIASIIATGRTAPLLSQGKDEAEDEKRIGSMLLAGVPLMTLDNIERPVGGQLLNSMLTEPTCNPRILCKSETPTMPCNLTLFATGNNLQFMGDMVRRVLICRIDAGCERPDSRTFSKNLNDWVPKHRSKLLEAALIVLRAYVFAGFPAQNIPPYGSFEGWSRLVRSALVWLGMADPCLSRVILEQNDPISGSLQSILPLWSVTFGEKELTSSEICRNSDEKLLDVLLTVASSRRDPERLDSTRLGKWLQRNKDRVYHGLRIEKSFSTSLNVATWKVVNASKPPIINCNKLGSPGSPGLSYSAEGKLVNENDSQRLIIALCSETSPASPATPGFGHLSHLSTSIAQRLAQLAHLEPDAVLAGNLSEDGWETLFDAATALSASLDPTEKVALRELIEYLEQKVAENSGRTS